MDLCTCTFFVQAHASCARVLMRIRFLHVRFRVHAVPRTLIPLILCTQHVCADNLQTFPARAFSRARLLRTRFHTSAFAGALIRNRALRVYFLHALCLYTETRTRKRAYRKCVSVSCARFPACAGANCERANMYICRNHEFGKRERSKRERSTRMQTTCSQANVRAKKRARANNARGKRARMHTQNSYPLPACAFLRSRSCPQT